MGPHDDLQRAKQLLPLPRLLHRLGLGQKARKNARCPFHVDQKASFSVFIGNDGRWYWKCFSGCGDGDEPAFLAKYKNIPIGDAIKLYKEMAGVVAAPPSLKPAAAVSPSNWRACVQALTDKDLEQLADWRGFSGEFCSWLKQNQLLGLYEGCIAFPVHDAAGNVPAIHYRLKDGTWRYYPPGVKMRPLVIGELTRGDPVHLFESTWDGLDYMDKSGERSGVIISRGNANGALAAALIPQGATAYLWTQNDAAGEKWQRDICANTEATAKRAKIPAQHKDLNDWTRAGATTDDLLAAMMSAETIREAEPRNDAVISADEVARDEPDAKAEQDDLPEFPAECLPPLVEAIAKEVCATERVPGSLVGCCALGILSASIGAGLAVQSASNRVTRANIYLLATAESGSGKSETFRHMARPFRQFEMERINRWKELDRFEVIARRELLEVDIKQCKKHYAERHADDIGEELKKFELEMEELEKRLDPPTLSCEDVTTEKLADLLSKNDEQLASLSPDALSIVNILLGRYNKLDRTDEGLYLKAYSGDPCQVHRMSRDPIQLESPCLTALWLTQPDKLQSLLDERSLNEGGLIPRILACHADCEPREIGKNPPSISSSVEKAYAGLIYSLLTTYRRAPRRFTIKPTSEALEALNDHHDAIVKRRRGELRDVTSYAARWNEQAWRITVCLHAGTYGSQSHKHPVALETAQRAIALADWFAEEQLRILNTGRMERKAARLKKLKELVIQCYNGAATLRDLDKSNNFKQDEVRELASRFPDILVIEKRVTGGRPSEIVSIIKNEI
jgi:Protein of unknown function (DUF3987)/CHC2 zinc finger